MRPTQPLWILLGLLATTALMGWGCDGGLSISWDDDAGDDDASDDDAGDDDAGDDDAGDDDDGGDDDAGDDDAADDDAGDDDTEPDFSHIEGSYLYFVDFGEIAEGMGYTDCEAPYTLVGPNVTGSTQHLCESCDHIFQLSHNPDPFQQVEDCVSQLGYEGGSYERLYGFEWLTDDEFSLWRNFGDVEAELEDFGWGAIEGAEFWFDSDISGNWWVNTWSEGDGIFGG